MSSTRHMVMPGMACNMLVDQLRDVNTTRTAFVHHADRVCRLLVEEGLAWLAQQQPETVDVTTPCGTQRHVRRPYRPSELCGVSIMRSGDILLQGLLTTTLGGGDGAVHVGKILIQRDDDDDTARPRLFYDKLPQNVADLQVLLLDPMLATGGSATTAVRVLTEHGVQEENILFLNILSCPEGLAVLAEQHPGIFTITVVVDPCLNEQKYIVPGLGDFGDRYYGTE